MVVERSAENSGTGCAFGNTASVPRTTSEYELRRSSCAETAAHAASIRNCRCVPRTDCGGDIRGSTSADAIARASSTVPSRHALSGHHVRR